MFIIYARYEVLKVFVTSGITKMLLVIYLFFGSFDVIFFMFIVLKVIS